ncbi:MAG: DUF192 domain-containing protein [Hyphomicrobiaceae bacterium]
MALLLLFLGAVMALRIDAAAADLRRDTLVIETRKGPQSFVIEVAETPEQKQMGLMFRRSLARGHGMLFPHEPPQIITMWMRNTYISLDMVFIGKDGRVTRIAERTEPFSERTISSESLAAAVLEIGGGEAERLGIREGDLVRHALFGTAK